MLLSAEDPCWIGPCGPRPASHPFPPWPARLSLSCCCVSPSVWSPVIDCACTRRFHSAALAVALSASPPPRICLPPPQPLCAGTAPTDVRLDETLWAERSLPPPASAARSKGVGAAAVVGGGALWVPLGGVGGGHRPGRAGQAWGLHRSVLGSPRESMAPYSIPAELLLVEDIPRNQMGKVDKKQLLRQFYSA